MKPFLLAWVLTTVAMLYLQGCATTPSAVITADEKGLVVRPVAPMTSWMSLTSLLTGYAISRCSAQPEFRGCADIFCQMDVRHKNCSAEDLRRLRRKGVL